MNKLVVLLLTLRLGNCHVLSEQEFTPLSDGTGDLFRELKGSRMQNGGSEGRKIGGSEGRMIRLKGRMMKCLKACKDEVTREAKHECFKGCKGSVYGGGKKSGREKYTKGKSGREKFAAMICKAGGCEGFCAKMSRKMSSGCTEKCASIMANQKCTEGEKNGREKYGKGKSGRAMIRECNKACSAKGKGTVTITLVGTKSKYRVCMKECMGKSTKGKSGREKGKSGRDRKKNGVVTMICKAGGCEGFCAKKGDTCLKQCTTYMTKQPKPCADKS